MAKLFPKLREIFRIGGLNRRSRYAARQRRSLLTLHLLIEPLAYDSPVAEVLRDRPNQFAAFRR